VISLPRPMICVVTPGTGRATAIISAITAAARAGADLVHIRERQLSDRALVDLVRRAVDATRGTSTRVLVNDRADVAMAALAAGVHLRGDAMPASRVRAVVPDWFLIGRSVHSVAAAREAEADGGCNYLVFGTVFRSESKPEGHPAAGLDALEGVCRAVRLPVIAIGGITEARVPEVARAGAAGIAAISLFAGAEAAGPAVAAVRRRFDTRS
jgi:thiamine-phosphate diphosphorylase